MKTAIYIENGVIQLVLTPENKFEKDALGAFAEKKLQTQIFSGEFYDCRGGWTRQREFYGNQFGEATNSNERSLILRYAEPSQSETASEQKP